MGEAANDAIDGLPQAAASTDEPLAELYVETIGWDESEEDWEFEIERARVGEWLPATALGLAAVAWTGFIGWTAFSDLSGARLSLTQIANWIAIGCVPLALIGVVWIMLRRTSKREAMRFGRTAEAMRAETKRLDFAMALIRTQLAEMRQSIADETDRLMALGDEAAGRLGAIGADMRDACGEIEAKSHLLGGSAKTARNDIEVLMNDLPRAEERARTVSASLREAGVNAHEQAGSLDAQLSALAVRGREADDIASGAAQRLAANLAQIEGVAAVAASGLDETGTRINAAIEDALERSGKAVDETRRAVEEIGAALAAMVETARAGFDHRGEGAAAALETRIGSATAVLDDLEAKLGEQSAATGTMLDTLDGNLGGVESRITAIGEAGAVHIRRLGEEIVALEADMRAMGEQIGGNDAATERLIGRAAKVKAALDLSTESLDTTLPRSLASVEQRAGETRDVIAALTPEVVSLEESAAAVLAHMNGSADSLAAQSEALNAFVAHIDDRIATMRQAASDLETTLGATGEQARSIADAAAPRLIEALLRVRETADQAAERARTAIGEVIPQSAAALGEATREAMTEAIGANVEARMADISAASANAIAAAERASENLAARIGEIATSSAAIEARIEEARAETEAADMNSFARRVTLLIESLNSTAIDVTKILSNDVTDTAWAAYLKGDRGIFARRAVRLLDSGEAREIAHHYEEEPEFHQQVNRYIHDFEAMLRRVLATRDGSPLAVTLLSSDNGKLYVALAQAIERIRS